MTRLIIACIIQQDAKTFALDQRICDQRLFFCRFRPAFPPFLTRTLLHPHPGRSLLPCPHPPPSPLSPALSQLNMAVIDTRKPAKASTRPGKEVVVAEVTSLLEKSSMVFSLPSAHITANQVVALRKNMPDGCTAKVVKNTLMRIACKGSEFEGLTDVTTGENFWMFVEGEDNLAEPIKYVAEFAKQFDKAAVSAAARNGGSSGNGATYTPKCVIYNLALFAVAPFHSV